MEQPHHDTISLLTQLSAFDAEQRNTEREAAQSAADQARHQAEAEQARQEALTSLTDEQRQRYENLSRIVFDMQFLHHKDAGVMTPDEAQELGVW